MRTRSRSSVSPSIMITQRIYNPVTHVLYSTNYNTAPAKTSVEEITDETHKGPPWTSGGPLLLNRLVLEREVTHTHGEVYYNSYTSTEGTFGATFVGPYSVPTSPYYDTAALTALGTEGWRRYGPLRPNMDLNQTIAELRKAGTEFRQMGNQLKTFLLNMDRLWKTVRGAARLHLMIQFGVLPIIQDLFKLKKSYEFTRKRIAYIRKMNGKPVRVGGPLRDYKKREESVVLDYGGYEPSVSTLAWHVSPFQKNWSKETTRKVWFKGRCSFYLPVEDTPAWRARMYLQQGLGINLSLLGILRTIYQVTPWSWLADWFVNTGDILANYVSSRNNGIVYDYAYVMDHEIYKVTNELPIMRLKNTTEVFRLRSSTTREFKLRHAASPFGFGLSMPDDLSDWQKSILLALGIAKAKAW